MTPVFSTSDAQRRVDAFERDLEFLEQFRDIEDIAAYVDLSRAYYLEADARGNHGG